MQTFEQAFREQLLADPKLKRRGRRLLAIIDGPASRRRTRRLARMERHALACLDEKQLLALKVPATVLADPNGLSAIDWSKIDWKKVFMTILETLLKFLPLILMIL